MTIYAAGIKVAVAGLSGLIGIATGVTIPATLQALDLFNAIQDRRRRDSTKDLAKAAAAEIAALQASEYAREPVASTFASALATAGDTLDRYRLTNTEFLQLRLQPERAADAVLAHARFNLLDGDDLPATARRILACFYAKLREEKALLEAVLPDVYGEIMRLSETLDGLDAGTERIEAKLDEALNYLRQLAQKEATIAALSALESATRALARDAEAAPEEPELERALALLAQGKTEQAEAHFREVADRKAESGREKLAAGARELKEAAQAERHLGALATLRSVTDALAAYRRAVDLDPDDIDTWIWISRLERTAGRLEAGEEAGRRAITAARAAGNQYDEGIAQEALGAVQIAQGIMSGALASFSARHAITSKFAAADRSNAGLQRDLSVSWEKMGDVRVAQGDLAGALEAYRASKCIRDRLSAVDPSIAKWQHDLSVSWNKIGGLLLDQSDLVQALHASTAAKVICDRLAAGDPTNAEWQLALSLSWEKTGDVQMAQGDLAGALDAYTAAKGIRGRLAEEDPQNAEWRRDLSVSWNKLGDVLQAQGDLAGALAAHTAAKAIAEQLAAADPTNAGWQRDLSVSLYKLGALRVAQGDLIGSIETYEAFKSIAERLATTDPSNAGWQRDLSVSWESIGDVRAVQGDLAGALNAYMATYGIIKKLAEAEPGHTGRQRDLSISWRKIGDVLLVKGDPAGALDAYTASHAIAERVAVVAPRNAGWQRDLIISHLKLSAVAAEPAAVRAHLAAALAIARTLQQSRRLAPVDAWMPADLEQRLAKLTD